MRYAYGGSSSLGCLINSRETNETQRPGSKDCGNVQDLCLEGKTNGSKRVKTSWIGDKEMLEKGGRRG